MRVVHVSTYASGSGAALAAYRLHRGLLASGCGSTMFVSQPPDEPDPTVKVFAPPRNLRTGLRRRLHRLQIARSHARYQVGLSTGLEMFSDDRSPHGAELVTQLPACDVIHVHAMFDFVDYRTFFALAPRRARIVRTMHDMSFFTGGCHYDGGCGKYTARCGACPQLGSQTEKDLSRQIWERKRAALSAVPPGSLNLVTPSRWLAEEARRSTLLRSFPVTVIPLGIDTDIFCPRDRRTARSVLGLPPEAFIVLFVANPITRVNKGFAHLAQAVDGLPTPGDLLLLSVGSGRPPVDVRVPHHHLGRVRDERLLSIIYNAADLFVIPSMQDNSPQTALEAMACGVPIVGYATCGIPDIVRPDLTGLLAPPQDVPALRAAIEMLMRGPTQRAELSAQCRRVAVEEYSLMTQARHYIEFYESILGGMVYAPDALRRTDSLVSAPLRRAPH